MDLPRSVFLAVLQATCIECSPERGKALMHIYPLGCTSHQSIDWFPNAVSIAKSEYFMFGQKIDGLG